MRGYHLFSGMFLLAGLLSSTNAWADSTPPTITALSVPQPIFIAGEVLSVQFAATDSESGVHVGCCSSVVVSPWENNVFRYADSVNGSVRSLGGGQFEARPFPINPYVDTTTSSYAIARFSVWDSAGNEAFLYLD